MPNPSPFSGRAASVRVASYFLAVLSFCFAAFLSGCTSSSGSSGGSSGGNGGTGGTGAATKLVFTNSPGGANAGTAFAGQPVVTVEDANGNTVTSSTASITVAITSGTGTNGAALTCTANTVAAVAGVATFAGCSINLTGNGYTLSASSSGLTTGVSPSFGISPGAATHLTFTVEPQTAPLNTNMASIAVAVKDALGNTVTTNSVDSVTLAITIGTGTTGAALACSGTTTAVVVTAGVATFTNCQINMTGTGYTLTATSAGLTGAVSSTFNITTSLGPASKLGFEASPNGGNGAAVWTTQPVVAVQDANGNTITSGTGSNASITLSIAGGTGAGGATLACNNNTVTASAGVASFAGCQINLASVGYKLTATASGLTNGTSASFSITVGPATKLAFTTQPGGGTGGTPWTQQPVVMVQDAGGNTVAGSSASIALAVAAGTGSGVLNCTSNPLGATAGVATFVGCKINLAGTDYALTASSSGLSTATSGAFDVTIGPATRLIFGTEPSGAVAGTAFSVQPVVIVKDAGGDNITTSSASITLSLTTGSGTLACTGSDTLAASSGLASFAGCQISASGTGDVLTASASGLTSAQSTAFNVETSVGAAARLAFTVQPANTEVGIAISPAVQVTVVDSNGVPVTSATNQITLTLNGSATLGGGGTISASGGVATFSILTVGTAGTGYTLQATATGLTSATSNAFNVFSSLAPNCSGAPNGSEFLMTGHWAALLQGWTGPGAGTPLHVAFAVSTDGAGSLTNLDGTGGGGQFDRQNGSGGASSYLNNTIEQAGSSYVIGQDPTSSGFVGCMTMALSGGGTQHFWFALGGITGTGNSARASKATITRWDDVSGTGARGAGVMLPQDSSKFSLASLSANFAFGVSGVDPSGEPFAEAGASTLNTGTGAISLQFDYDDGGSGGLVTGGTGTLSGISNLTGRGNFAATVTINSAMQNSNNVIYIINNNEYFILTADPYSTNPILSGRAIVTTHGSVPGISGNFIAHLTGTSTVSSGGGCTQNNVLVDCANVNLVAIKATSTGAQTSSITGFSWEYVQGETVTPDAVSGVTATVDATWGRLALSGTSVQQAPVFYLATPQTGADPTEPFVGFAAGSGTGGNLDPSALSGFMEAGASTNVSQSAIAGNYFLYSELPGDNFVGTGVGVVHLSSSGSLTGTQYAQEGSQGLAITSLTGGTVTITNADPVVLTDTFPGIANSGPGSFGLTNGKRFIFFDTGSSYGTAGTSGAQFLVVDQQ